MRKRIYQIIVLAEKKDSTNRIYDVSMMLVIFTSLISLAFKEQTPAI